MNKLSAHADDRLRERTNLPPEVLHALRRHVARSQFERGHHHVRLPDGSAAVLKDTGDRHVVATVLSRNMHPPGKDVSHHVRSTRERLLKVAAASGMTYQDFVDKLRPGDIVFTSDKKPAKHPVRRAFKYLSRKIQGTDHDHAALYVGNGKIVDALIRGGVRERSLRAEARVSHLMAYAPKASEKQRQKAVEFARQAVGTPYSFLRVLRAATPFRGARPEKVEGRAGEAVICSGLVANAYSGVSFSDKHPALVRPVELMRSKRVELVGRLGGKEKTADAARRYLMRKLLSAGEAEAAVARAVTSSDPYMSKAIAALPKDPVTGKRTAFAKYMGGQYPADASLRADAQVSALRRQQEALAPHRTAGQQSALEGSLQRTQDRQQISGRHVLRIAPPDPALLPAGAEYVNPNGFTTYNMPRQGVLFRGGRFPLGADGYGYAHMTRHPDVAGGYAASVSTPAAPGNLYAYRTKGMTRAGETTHLAMKPEDAYADLAGRRARSVSQTNTYSSQSGFIPPTYEDIVKFNPAKPPQPLASWTVASVGQPAILNRRPKFYQSGEAYRTQQFAPVLPKELPDYYHATPVGNSPRFSTFMPQQ